MRIDNTQLREAFLASRLSAREVAERCGWTYGGRQIDSSRVERSLGIKPYREGYEPQKRIEEENAIKIARAIGLAPYEIGL